MIEPYQALGLVPTMRGIRRRDEIQVNLEHLSHLIKAASWLSSLDLPVRLIAVPEGALQGFNDEVLDLDHEEFAQERAIDIPGPETDYPGGPARQWNCSRWPRPRRVIPSFPGSSCSSASILSPQGDVILKHHKVVPLLGVEHSVTPCNVLGQVDRAVRPQPRRVYPVADTEIGRLGFPTAYAGPLPGERARARPCPAPRWFTGESELQVNGGNGLFEIQNRAPALDNNMYLIACNVCTYYLHPASFRRPHRHVGRGVGGRIHYRGQIACSPHQQWGAGCPGSPGPSTSRRCAVPPNAQWDNRIRDLTTEQYQIIYEEPGYRRASTSAETPYAQEEYRHEVIAKQVELMHERDIWVRPDDGEAPARRNPCGRLTRYPGRRSRHVSRVPMHVTIVLPRPVGKARGRGYPRGGSADRGAAARRR